MSEHTPAPWVVDCTGSLERPGIGAMEGRQTIVIFGHIKDDADDGGIRGRTPKEAMANANLIAAAPDLLEALEACMKIIGPPHAEESECWATTDEINAAWDIGTTAITKAKGDAQ